MCMIRKDHYTGLIDSSNFKDRLLTPGTLLIGSSLKPKPIESCESQRLTFRLIPYTKCSESTVKFHSASEISRVVHCFSLEDHRQIVRRGAHGSVSFTRPGNENG